MDMGKKKGSILVLTIFSTIALTLFLIGFCSAGSLEPSEPPSPTMKTLDEIYHKPIWNMYDQVFVDWPGNPRFAVNDNGSPADVTDDSVLDKETGLVWERNPVGFGNWYDAHYICDAQKYYSRRRGWRLPTFHELASLVDMRADYPKLSSGHPFTNVQIYDDYWSSTTRAGYTSDAWFVRFYNGNVYFGNKTANCFVWCVRGGQGLEVRP
jgi:hypothetical protein